MTKNHFFAKICFIGILHQRIRHLVDNVRTLILKDKRHVVNVVTIDVVHDVKTTIY